jgi:hypothetical protein
LEEHPKFYGDVCVCVAVVIILYPDTKLLCSKLSVRKWGIRKEGNISIAAKKGQIYNGVFCLDLIMNFCITVFGTKVTDVW